MLSRGHGIGDGDSQPPDVKFKDLLSLTFSWSAGLVS